MTTTTQQTDTITKVKTAAELKFNAVKTHALELVNRCNLIKITDAGSLAMANQLLSEMNDAVKTTEAKGLEMRKGYNEACDIIMESQKSITVPLKSGIEIGKGKLREWNAEQQKIKDAADEINKKSFEFLKNVSAAVQAKLPGCTTEQACLDLIASIEKNFPAYEKFGQYSEDAKFNKHNFIVMLEIKAKALKEVVSPTASPESVIAKIEEAKVVEEAMVAQQEVVLQKKENIAEATTVIKSAVRKTWKWEVVDEAALTREFLSVDDKKVNAYMSAYKTKFDPKGSIAGGIRFYLDEMPAIK